MGMETEWTFTKKGRKTEAQRTRMEENYSPISPDDHKELVELFEYLIGLIGRDKRIQTWQESLTKERNPCPNLQKHMGNIEK